MDIKLQTTFNFTQNDLRYNRLLQLSPDQRRQFSAYTAPIFRAMGALLLLAIGWLVAMWTAELVFGDGGFSLLGFVGAVGLVVVVGVGLLLAMRLIEPLLPGIALRVLAIQGEIRLQSDGDRPRVKIKQWVFDLTDDQLSALIDGRSYRFYYTPAIDRILSVEEAAPPANNP